MIATCAVRILQLIHHRVRRGELSTLALPPKIVGQAVELGFENIYFTGGELFILDDCNRMLAYSAARRL